MVADPVQPPVTTPVFEKTWVLKYMENGPNVCYEYWGRCYLGGHGVQKARSMQAQLSKPAASRKRDVQEAQKTTVTDSTRDRSMR